MYFPIIINWTSPFPILGLLGGIVHFYSNFKRNFCKQTVENLTRRCILQRLIWFCTVCQCPTKRTLGLYGLNPLQKAIKCSASQYVRPDLGPNCWTLMMVLKVKNLQTAKNAKLPSMQRVLKYMFRGVELLRCKFRILQ